jgi:hypothetical protein
VNVPRCVVFEPPLVACMLAASVQHYQQCLAGATVFTDVTVLPNEQVYSLLATFCRQLHLDLGQHPHRMPGGTKQPQTPGHTPTGCRRYTALGSLLHDDAHAHMTWFRAAPAGLHATERGWSTPLPSPHSSSRRQQGSSMSTLQCTVRACAWQGVDAQLAASCAVAGTPCAVVYTQGGRNGHQKTHPTTETGWYMFHKTAARDPRRTTVCGH